MMLRKLLMRLMVAPPPAEGGKLWHWHVRAVGRLCSGTGGVAA